MNPRSVRSQWLVSAAVCLLLPWSQQVACADGSIRFNGTTSKIQDDTADVMDGSGSVTICAWVYPISSGEGGAGVIVALDKDGNAVSVQHDAGSSFAFHAQWDTFDGKWLFPLPSNTWSAVAVSYSNGNVHNNPDGRLNFATATRMQDSEEPEENPITAGTSYCIGNFSDGSRTWDGRIAHVQIFKRILTADEMDACLQAPGSITDGLRLWLPMTNTTDIKDRSTSGFDGTATALANDISGPMITEQPGVLPGLTILSHGVTNKTQHEIPRYANGVTHPGGQLRGVGPASVIRGTAATDDQTVKAVVFTEDYDEEIAEYQSDEEEEFPAVLQATIRDLTIAGHDDTGNNYQSGDGLVNNVPAQWNRVTGYITDVTDDDVPVEITSTDHGLLTGDTVFISGVEGNQAANGGHEITKITNHVFALDSVTGNGNYDGGGVWTTDSRWQEKYHGLLIRGSGLLVRNVNFFYFPGTALKITDGGAGGPTGPRLPFDREISRVWGCKVNRAYSGFLIDTNAVVGRLEGFGLRDYGIKFTKPGARIDGALHFYGIGIGGVAQPAVWFAEGADNCAGGPIYAENSPIAMLIESSGNMLHHIYSLAGFSKNLVIKGERNTIGPVSIDVSANATGIVIHDQFNKVLGGSIQIDVDSSAVGVHIASGGDSGKGLVIRDIRFYGQSQFAGTAMTTDAVLNNCTIEAHFQRIGTGIELNPGGQSKLGVNNTIRVTTFQVSEAINLPMSIDASNHIWVDGVEQ